MSYQVLARKWRPKTFATMVGQEHVLRALINALDNDRLHHAYLFTGTRGVGKTTVARIFAKSLNCEQGVGSTPCDVCSACTSINEGRFIDLIEVDAASRTKVEDTRELLENVQYAPTAGRYKVYLIDEVHMLSNHSFNALLKTLEEPPPHVKFLLATTDPKKLPVTILSRCLQFNLKRLTIEMIATHLSHVMTEESISTEDAAIAQIAEGADGSMRDALSLLDQAIAYGGGKLTESDVSTMLGTIDRSYIYKLLQGLADADAASLLETVHGLAMQSADFSAVLAELISQLHKLALLQIAPQALDGATDNEMLQDLANEISAEDVQLFYQTGLVGRRDLSLAPDARSGFEMILLRMLAFRPTGMNNAAPVPQATGQTPSKPATAAVKAVPQSNLEPQPAATMSKPKPASSGGWSDVVAQLGLKGMAYQLAANSVMTGREGNVVNLSLSNQHASLRSANMEQRLQEALQRHYGEEIKLSFAVASTEQETPARQQQRQADDRQQEAVDTINDDPNVQRIQDVFNAKVVGDSVRPID